MPTNKIALRTVEEYMGGYTPGYKSIYPLFLGKSQQYKQEVGKTDFRRLEAVSDIRLKHITPKDTEIRQISVMEGKKTFKRYFLANQYVHSDLQDRQGIEDVVSQVLDEHHIQADEMLLKGDGTTNNNVLNNGLFYSGDANYTTEASTEIQNSDYLADLHTKVMTTAQKADEVAGKKLLIFYGTGILPLFNGVYSTAVRPFKSVLKEILGQNWDFMQLPSQPTPSGTNGWIAVNLDQVKLHYTVLPQLLAQGHNEEKLYYWHNFIMGSMMLEVLAKNGVIHQPATIEAP